MEVADRHSAHTAGSLDDHGALERGAHRREVLGRVGLAHRAAHGSAVAHHRIGDHLLGLTKDRVVLSQHGRVEDLRMRGHGTDDDLVAVDPDPAQFVDPLQVDEHLGTRDSQSHHRDEAVPAGEEA